MPARPAYKLSTVTRDRGYFGMLSTTTRDRGYFFISSLLVLLILANIETLAQAIDGNDPFRIGRIKYGGGGDWYSNSSSLPNLLKFVREQTDIRTVPEEDVVELSNPRLFGMPYLYMNGHGNIRLTDREVRQLKNYFGAGGFLHADDNYGMDQSFRREMKRVLPEAEFVEIPFNHPIYHSHFDFPAGPPKIHEHDNKPAQGLGLFLDGKMVVYYTYQSDLGDGWEDPDVHNDPPEKRMAALRMGCNIIVWRLRGGQ